MAKKNALGKGLAALLGDDVFAEKQEQNQNQQQDSNNVKNARVLLKVKDIIPYEDQPRKIFDEKTITELAQSISEKGVLQPVIVRKKGDKYVLVIGERRWRATQKAGLDEIPALIRDFSDVEALEVALIENIQREDLNPMEEAASYSQLIEKLSITHEELSERLGKSRTAITNKMRLMKLPESVQENIVMGSISEGHGKAILYLDDEPEKMEILYRKVVDDKLSVRDTEAIAKKWTNLSLNEIKKSLTKTVSEKKTPAKSPDVLAQEQNLSEIFGSKVIIEDKNNKGKIIISYNDLEDFQRILENIKGVNATSNNNYYY